ncbi:DUF4031 domain-containing protein [Eleftheria terrae]|uniref:DUF4031 domain-containing protein n=1 Tax=Eleftheria terrae TaxID=1597781 RepID=UPI00343AAC0B
MTVYVDDMHTIPMGQYGRMKMCHMVADSTDELLAMADRIGVARQWLQKAGTHHEHFDIAMSKRAEAVKAGAVEVTMSEVGRITRGKREAAVSAGGMTPYRQFPEQTVASREQIGKERVWTAMDDERLRVRAKDIRIAGWEAGRAGLPASNNPYPKDSSEHETWRAAHFEGQCVAIDSGEQEAP